MASIRKHLFKAYWQVESALVPGLTTSQHAYYLKLRELAPRKIWLDLGCGHQVFAEWMEKEQAEVLASCREVFGIDLDWAGLKGHQGIRNKVFGDLGALPFADASVELVSANMVIEHLESPVDVLKEVYRCLRPGGQFVFHTPNFHGWATRVSNSLPETFKKRLIWALERRKEEDVFPTHYRLNTAEQIQNLAAEAKLKVDEIKLVSSSAVTASFGPLAIPELLYIRTLQAEKNAGLRSNIIATLRKGAA